jgi:hypothetical protein
MVYRSVSMRLSITLTAVVVGASILFGAGCRKKKKVEDDDTPVATAAPEPPPPPPPAPTSTGLKPGEVQRYSDEVPMGSVTVELLREFTIHQAADLNSPVIAHVGRGVMINVKATHSNWMLIEYPSAVATMSPGWIDLRNIYDRRVRVRNGRIRPPAIPARLPGKRDRRRRY